MRLGRRSARESDGSQRFDEGFRIIAEAMPQLVWVARPDGTIEYLNQRWIEYTDVDLDEMHRRSGDVGVIHADELDEQEYEIRGDADGSYPWFLGRAVPIRDDGGTVLCWIDTATDINDRQRARDLHDRSIVLHVIDSGPPVSVSDWQLPDDTLSERGRGLFIIAQHGAHLRIEHVANSGNHVSVEIPMD